MTTPGGRSGSQKRRNRAPVTGWFTPAEAEALRDQAARAGISVSALVRRAMLGAKPPRAARRPPVELQALARVLGQLGKIGSNVNQLAHYANAGRLMPDSIELALLDLSEMRLALLQALGHEVGPDSEAELEEDDAVGEDHPAPTQLSKPG